MPIKNKMCHQSEMTFAVGANAITASIRAFEAITTDTAE